MRLHFYRVEIESRYIYRVLNSSGDINLRKIQIDEEKASFEVDYKDIENLKIILNNLNINILHLTEKGAYVKIINFPVIKSFVCILMIFVLIMSVNSLFIWNISVDGNYTYSNNQIISFLHSKKIVEGMKKSKISCDSIEKAVRKKFEDVSWVCAEIKGTNLIVHIKENYITEISTKEDKPYDIISNRDGKITSLLVRQGKAAVKVGDTVKKGDVLISGVVDVTDESEQKLFTKFCTADGDIMAETIYQYSDSIEIDYEKKIRKNTKTIYLPTAFGYKWMNLTKSKNKDIIYSEKQMKIFGNFYLPLSIQKYTFIKYNKEAALRTKEQAAQLLNNKLLYKLAVMEQKGYKILKKDVKIYKEKESYVLKGTITCREPLGAVSYIDTEQYLKESEEGTTEFNERN